MNEVIGPFWLTGDGELKHTRIAVEFKDSVVTLCGGWSGTRN